MSDRDHDIHRETIEAAAKSMEATARALRKYLAGDELPHGLMHSMLTGATMSCLAAADSMGAARARREAGRE